MAHPSGDQQAHHRRRPLRGRRRRVLAGLAAREALLPRRPAHRDGRRHAGDRRARPRGREDRHEAHQEGELHRVGRRVRAEGAHAVPVVRPERRARAAAQGRAAARRPQAHRRASCAGTTPRRRSPRASPAAATAGSGGSSSGCGATAARSRSGASGSRSTAGSTRWRPRASTPTGTSPVTAPTTRSSRGTTSRPACTVTSSGTTGRPSLREHGLPDCRWTPCYDCGVCTDYALEHVVASAVPPAGGSQGTGQGLGFGNEVARGAHPQARERDVVRATDGFPVRVRFTKRGKVRFISHRDVARGFERAFRIEELPLAFTLGFSPRPKVSFGLALSVGHESIAEYLDVELREPVDTDAWPERLSAALPEGIDVTGVGAARRPRAGPAGSGHAGRIPGCGRGCRRRTRRPRRAQSCCHTRAHGERLVARHPHPQGSRERGRHPSRDRRVHARVRQPTTPMTASGPRAHPVNAIPRRPAA